jgi:hypothetical protein
MKIDWIKIRVKIARLILGKTIAITHNVKRVNGSLEIATPVTRFFWTCEIVPVTATMNVSGGHGRGGSFGGDY